MKISPEEKADGIRILEAALRETADIQWEFKENISKGLELKIIDSETSLISISLPCGGGLIYASNLERYSLSQLVFARFFHKLEEKIKITEGEISNKGMLELAAASIDTMLRREEFEGKGVDPYKFFKTQFDRVIKVYSELWQELADFPIDIFTHYLFGTPKNILKNARKKLEKLADRKEGKTLLIRNTRSLTVGFRKNDNSMLFDPIDFYYTDEERSQSFRKQLVAYIN